MGYQVDSPTLIVFPLILLFLKHFLIKPWYSISKLGSGLMLLKLCQIHLLLKAIRHAHLEVILSFPAVIPSLWAHLLDIIN